MANARPFSGMDKVDISGGSRDPFLQLNNVIRDLSKPEKGNITSSSPAQYVVRIDQHEYFSTRKSGDSFKAKLSVIAGNGPSAIGTGKPGPDGKPQYNRAAFMVMASSDYFKRDVARHICNLMNAPPKPFTNSRGEAFPGFKESDYEFIVSAAQPLVGRFVWVEVMNSKGTKAPFNDFTNHRWLPILPVLAADGVTVADWQHPDINNVTEWLAQNQGKDEG